MYFALDEDRRMVVDDDGNEYTTEQFKEAMREARNGFDMTLTVQRWIRFDFDFDKLNDFYNSCD